MSLEFRVTSKLVSQVSYLKTSPKDFVRAYTRERAMTDVIFYSTML